MVVTSISATLKLIEGDIALAGDAHTCILSPGATFEVNSGAGKSGWSGYLHNHMEGITPITNLGTNYTVPNGKILVVTSKGSNLRTVSNSKWMGGWSSPNTLIPGITFEANNGSGKTGWTGYFIDPTKL